MFDELPSKLDMRSFHSIFSPPPVVKKLSSYTMVAKKLKFYMEFINLVTTKNFLIKYI